MRLERAYPKVYADLWTVAIVAGSIEDPKCPASELMMIASKWYPAAATLYKNLGRKRCASRADDDAENNRDDPS